MAAYIPVPRDLTRVKSKVFFNLTKRQLICFSLGGTDWSAVFLFSQTLRQCQFGCDVYDYRHASSVLPRYV